MTFSTNAAMKQCYLTITVKMMAGNAVEQVKIAEEVEIMRYANQVRFVFKETMFCSLPGCCAP